MKIKMALVASIFLTSTAIAQTPNGRDLAKIGFEAMDSDKNGNLVRSEMLNQTEAVFVSMDSDSDQALSEEEFLTWDFGMANVAKKEGKQKEFANAIKLVFDYWDRDNDQKLTSAEMQEGVNRSFEYADLNNDGVLEANEYLNGFVVNIAIRSALSRSK